MVDSKDQRACDVDNPSLGRGGKNRDEGFGSLISGGKISFFQARAREEMERGKECRHERHGTLSVCRMQMVME